MDHTGIIVTSQNHTSMDMCLTQKTRSAMSPEYLLNIINMLHKLITRNVWIQIEIKERKKPYYLKLLSY